MRVWTVHVPLPADDAGGGRRRPRRPGPVLVREGFSWGAFLFGPFWLLAHRLWLPALLWFVAAPAAAALLVAAGGGDVLDPAKTAELIGQLEPKVVIPMQYATPQGDAKLGTLETFCKELGVAVPTPEDKLVLRHSDLGETMRLVALTPDSERAGSR